ncbi:NUDIX domain-containing protein [Streptomyces sp. NPDC007808]|uniref:NUDIX hydrolase n=1 Tax=Streptomyces sp. NPDC007808 TaxID=3364779 RepID=UPI003691725F
MATAHDDVRTPTGAGGSDPAPPPEPENASVLVANDDGEYLLHLRDNLPGVWEPGAWSLLGGGREPGDRSLEETARRELWEEAGLVLPLLQRFRVELVTALDGATVPVQVFTARWNGDPDSLHLTEGVMLRWFAPEIMPRLRLSPSTLDLVRDHAAHRPAAPRSTVADAPVPPEAQRPAEGADRRGVPHVVGVHLYLENAQGEVLLGLRHPDCAFAGGRWHFLAGHGEQESAIACLVREAYEEAGLLIHPRDAELVHVVHLCDAPGSRPRLQLVFRVRRWAGDPVIREPDKCLTWRWWNPDALPEPIVAYTRTAVQRLREGHLYTETGWA